ncbi:hypothetical protein [Haloquadratum walsbyi]|uniref:hypothetical protein n=1 Tax=Haloquadratum walsbyi TaxID=293091 RepID=UPI0026EA4495|nr:hypothetical protein [Haloquadratum walsbyi]
MTIGIVFGGAMLLGLGPSPMPTEAVSLTTDQGNDDFDATITAQGRCGPTCFDIAAVIINQQPTQATDVWVTARVVPGYVKLTETDTDTTVYQTEKQIGTLSPGERRSVDQSIRWSAADALSVKNHGGRVTVFIEIHSTNAEMIFRERYDLI